MKYLVDANVLSEPTKPDPNAGVTEWLSRNEQEISVDAIVLGELSMGILALPAGRKRVRLEHWFEDLVQTLECLPWDAAVSRRWAKLVVELKTNGQTMPILDSMIAASVLHHGLTLVTRDVDICCRFSVANLMRIQKAVADLHPVHRSSPDLPLALTPEQCAALKNLYLKTDLGVVDCLAEVLGVGDFESVWRHSLELELPVGKCRILDIDALIRAKEAMNRDHDRITARQLREIRSRQHGGEK